MESISNFNIGNLFNIDILIFVAFLSVNLVVGLMYGRGVKTIKDYALGGRNFSTAALVSTIVATWASGSGFFTTLSKTYSDGLYYLLPSVCMGIQLIIMGYFLVPRMGEFLGNTSIAEAMGDLYGKEIRLITAICGIIGTIGGIAVQFKVFGNIFSYFLGINGTYSLYIAAAIVIIYSAFGGIRAVTYTDIVQFITFGLVIPLIGIIIWNSIYDKNISLDVIAQNPNFDLQKILNFGNPKFWNMIPLILYFAIPSIDSLDFQRISMGKNINQVKKAWLISAILLVLIKLITAWIPFLLEAIDSTLQPNQLIIYIADHYTFTGLKGFIIIGIAAMAMSTADSRINAASVLFANDISKVLNIKIPELTISRIFSVILGIFAIYLASSKADLLSIIMASASFYMPVAAIPCLMAIFGFRSTKKSVLIGMAAGFSTVLALNIFEVDADSIVLGMGINLVFLLGSHYLLRQQGGWVGIKDTTYLDNLRLERKKRNQAIVAKIKKFNFIKFCKEHSPTNELTYMWLGIYFIIQTFTTMYSTHVALLRENGKMILVIYQIMMVTGTLMAMYPIWPPRIKYEIIVQVAWNFVIFYMLIFFTCFFVMVSDFGRLQFLVLGLNMQVAAVLVGWRLGIAMAVIGFPLSIQFYKFYAKMSNINIANFDIDSRQFLFAYALMLAGAALIIFLKPRQERQEAVESQNEDLTGQVQLQSHELHKALGLKEQFIRNIEHEYHAPMTGIVSMAHLLDDSYNELSEEQRRTIAGTIFKSSLRLERFDDNIRSLAKLNKLDYSLSMVLVNLSELVYERVKRCRRLYEENKDNREFILNIEENLTVRGNKQYLSQLLDNLIINAITYCKEGKIKISLRSVTEDTRNNLEFTIADEGIGIPENELKEIFGIFNVSSRTSSAAGGRGLGLALCKRVAELHSGEILARNNQNSPGASFIFTLAKAD